MAVVLILSLADMKHWKRSRVAAAELDFPWYIAGEGTVVGGQSAGHGFADDLGAFEEEVEVQNELSPREEALSNHAVDYSQYVLQFLGYCCRRTAGFHCNRFCDSGFFLIICFERLICGVENWS